MSIQEISKSALLLAPAEKIQLTEILLASINDSSMTSFDKSWIQTASQRRNDLKTGKVKSISGQKVLQKARKKLLK
jgi:hypothetical protein